MSKYTLSDRTIYIDGRPMFCLSRHGNDSDGYNMDPINLDTMAHIIVNMLNDGDIPSKYSVVDYSIEGNNSPTDRARRQRWHIEECNGCHDDRFHD